MKQILFLFIISISFSQINVFKTFHAERNYFTENSVNRYDFIYTANNLFSYSDSTFNYLHQTLNYTDKLSDNLKFFISANLITTNYASKLYNTNFYEYKTYFESNFYLDEAFLRYNSSNFEFDFGRFIDKIGSAPFENLFVSNNDYHDGYRLKYNYKNIIFTNRFYQLAPINHKNSQISFQRYFFQHGISTRFFNNDLILEFHESALLSGKNRGIPLAYINPFLPYHANQLNDKTESNTHYTFISKYRINTTSHIWFEFFLDDIQTDSPSKSAGNKEPTEFGLILGGDYIYSSHKFMTNLAIIRNRTYNDAVEFDKISYNKFIDHGKIIGFKYGSNLISLRFLYQYYIDNESIIAFDFININFGNESVFSEFDDSFLTNASNSTESIPYGNIKNEISAKISYYKKYRSFIGIFALNFINDRYEDSRTILELNVRYELDK